LRIVFVIREDYLAQFDPFVETLPERLRPRFRLQPLRKYDATQAIKGPLQTCQVSLDNALESKIETIANELSTIRVQDPQGRLRQVKAEFVEPIQLQVVCQRWWQQRFTKNIEEVFVSDIADLENALEEFYENAVHNAAEKTNTSEQQIREWCEAGNSHETFDEYLRGSVVCYKAFSFSAIATYLYFLTKCLFL
jgi:hypothetical protein